MKILLSRARCLAVAGMWYFVCVLVLVLAGCGGGGNSANNAGGGNSGGGGGGGGSTNANLSTGVATLSGVVAVGSPVLGATVSVVDALGVDQGAAITAITDGSYQLTLSTTSRTLPLFIQAAGTDLQGSPVVVHTVVQSLTTGAGTQNIVHLNPVTNAVVALLLAGDPTSFFLDPAGYAAWGRLGNTLALAAAKVFVASVIRANLQDAQFTNPDNADFFSSSTFQANKTGLDAVLESVRFSFGRALNGHTLLQVSNSLALNGTTEVSIDLALADTDLATTAPSVGTDTIVSTLLTTTGTTSIMPSVSGLNMLTATINMGIARHLPPLELAALGTGSGTSAGSGIFSNAYQSYDGRDGLATITLLYNYGMAGYQLSNFQVLGCLDDPLPSGGGCYRIAVAALVRDANGVVVEVFRDAVTFSFLQGWQFIGNNKLTPWYLHPTTWAEFDATGTLDASVANNPGVGMQVLISAREFMQATLQTPNNHALQFTHCNPTPWTYMCVGLTETGDLIDDYVLRSTRIDWVGSIDAQPSARYRLQTLTLVNGNENNTMQVPTDLPSTSDTTLYPLPDDLAGTPLTVASFSSSATVSWAEWAAEHAGLRVIEVHRVIRSTASGTLKQKVDVLPLTGPQATLPAFTDPIPSDATTYVLWLIARDDPGRRYISKITAQP